jgi:hypothetical protein
MMRMLEFLLNDVPAGFRRLRCRLIGQRPSANTWIDGQPACARRWQPM